MAAEPKPSLDEYPSWLAKAANVKLDDQASRQYQVNVLVARDTCQNHSFFASLDSHLAEIAKSYEARNGARLFSDAHVNLVTKSYESAVNKSYRKNVVFNDRFPNAPSQGSWSSPDRWLATFEDIVRCKLVCRYIDGPKFVAEGLEALAKRLTLKASYDSVQHDRGYYAYHFYVRIPADLISATVTVEIQLTTHLQDVVYDLTHAFYEELRIRERAAQRDDNWKWEHKTTRFKASYLSHTLHLLEGLIAEVRGESSPRKESKEPNEHSKPEAPNPAGAIPAGDSTEGASGGA